ncbi:MAG: FKBP-type peptidyl-prolyl cis-trans isomerase [Nakamurella sp.]
MRVRAAALAGSVALAVLIAGCGGGDSGSPATSGDATSAGSSSSGSSSSSDGSSSPSSSAEAPNPGPEVPPATTIAPAVAKDLMPTATGGFGDKPVITFPKTPAPNSLQREILTEGTGAVVKSGDFLSASYLGVVWGADKAFDNSYDRKAPSTFQIGAGKVVPGWDTTLVGLKIGSRVLISLPPADGYGSTGNSGAGIKGTDTIVFVVDIVDTLPSDRGGEADAKPVPALPTGIPQVAGKLGERPTITIPKGQAAPTAARAIVLATGSGAKLVAGETMLAQYELVTWDGTQKQGTWPVANPTTPDEEARSGLQSIPLQEGSPFEKLVGLNIGSRVLLLVPATADTTGSGSGGTPALAAVVDIVAKG